MRRETALKHQFVEFIPDDLHEGVIYISVLYATASHKCCCGCGKEVVTPFSPTDWKLIFDGETISLDPSIGNWSFPCQSHYWIRHNRIRWAAQWSREEIDMGRKQDEKTKEIYFDERKPVRQEHVEAAGDAKPKIPTSSLWQQITRWFYK